ncbi:SDR family oxidoreductase [Thiocystis violacea]|uniref:SDR family oxidoreductase n=1 Tax=Thiocystis violacea TaxID=13725 RepID=UPI001F5B831F|nr:SDR family oxidoreductase [Thiocystis violacea]
MTEADQTPVAIVTGGAQGIDRALTQHFLSAGWIETGPWQKPGRRQNPTHRSIDQAQHAVGRIGEPADIVAAVAFLASPKAGFITGQNLVIDGGMTRTMQYAQ